MPPYFLIIYKDVFHPAKVRFSFGSILLNWKGNKDFHHETAYSV